jgi:Dimerisation and cyclophilin-binding domain of Mon2
MLNRLAPSDLFYIGVEIQLKILQALPPLLQNYADDLKGNLLGEALLICSILQGSKMGVVNNTAAASMPGLIHLWFDGFANIFKPSVRLSFQSLTRWYLRTVWNTFLKVS